MQISSILKKLVNELLAIKYLARIILFYIKGGSGVVFICRRIGKGGPIKKCRLLKNSLEFKAVKTSRIICYILSGTYIFRPVHYRILKSIPRVVFVLNQNGFYEEHAWDHPSNKCISNSIYFSDYIFFQSEYNKRRIIETLPFASVKANSVVHNGVFVPKESMDSIIKDKIVIYVNLANDLLHGVSQFFVKLRNLSNKNDFDLVLYGEGSKFFLSREFRFLSDLSSGEFLDLLRGCSAFVNLKVRESCPNAVLEALASGAGLMCLDEGGTKELLSSEDCVFSMADLVENPEGVAGSLILRAKEIRSNSDCRLRQVAHCERYFSLQGWSSRQVQILEEVFK